MIDYPEITAVKHWLQQTVIALNLCPFAKREWLKNRIRFTVTHVSTAPKLLQVLLSELHYLDQNKDTETSLIIHPQVLQQFHDYNDFLDEADALLVSHDYEGKYQIASFHPDYQFSGTQVDDAENYTNRSPYPLLHILREESLENAISSYPEPEKIPERNIELMNDMGTQTLKQRLNDCFKK